MKNYDVLFDEIMKCNVRLNELEWERKQADFEDDSQEVHKIDNEIKLVKSKRNSLCYLYDVNY